MKKGGPLYSLNSIIIANGRDGAFVPSVYMKSIIVPVAPLTKPTLRKMQGVC